MIKSILVLLLLIIFAVCVHCTQHTTSEDMDMDHIDTEATASHHKGTTESPEADDMAEALYSGQYRTMYVNPSVYSSSGYPMSNYPRTYGSQYGNQYGMDGYKKK